MPTALLPISHATWQVLRAVARAKGEPVRGHDLRLVLRRRTKDGAYLDALVTHGILSREMPLVSDPRDAKKPLPFRYAYLLTPEGERAAEYGECVRPYGTNL